MADDDKQRDDGQGDDGQGDDRQGKPLTPDPAATAAPGVALKDIEQRDPELAGQAAEYFRRQSVLLDMQAEDMREQRHIQLEQMKMALRREKTERLSGILKVATHIFFIVLATVVGVLGFVFLRDAVSSRTVIVESFEAPAALEPTGLTGKVVAARLLDELTKIQSLTRAAAVKRDLSSAWTNDIEVEVPETGTSVGEIMRAVRRTFGHDTHIDGDLVQEANGLTLSVRGDGVPPKAFAGAELQPLIEEAAKYVYSQSQPYLYLDYLNSLNMGKEAVEFAKSIYSTADPGDKPYILSQWAYASMSTGESMDAALKLYQEALRQKPDYWVAYNNVLNSLQNLGREEEAVRQTEEMKRAAGGRPGRVPDIYYQIYDNLTWNMAARLKGLDRDAKDNGGINTGYQVIGPLYAEIYWRQHDLAASELRLAATATVDTEPTTLALVHWVKGMLATERGDKASAADEMAMFAAAYSDPAVSMNLASYQCWAGPALEAAGRSAEADTVLASGQQFVDCRRFKADVLDARGDWSGAQTAYKSAVDLAPSMPAAYYSWGLALAKHGDLDGAIAKLAEAAKRGPNWADPLKAWGDVLMQKGDKRGALAKYRQALRFAPNWAELKVAHAAAGAE